MILLDGHSLTPAQKVPVTEMRLTLNERNSTATMTPVRMDGIGVNSWVKDETEPGAGIVWRVKGIKTNYANDTTAVDLEHVISTLKDRLMFGKVTPAMMSGQLGATTCTAQQAIQYILSQQSDWALGTCGYNVSNPYQFDGDSLFDALEKVSDSLENAMWTYDMSVYPFLLSIAPAPSGVGSEMRAGRNIRTISRTVDRSGMYTRFYPIGENDLHITGDYVSKNESTYGLVAHVETDTSISTEAELRRWANERLAKHAEPTVTTEIEGLELAAKTGEALDRLILGRECRMPLPEYSTTITERIKELSYPDKVNQPEMVRVTLSNMRNDVTKIIAESLKSAARGYGGRGAARRQKEDMAWFEDTNDHVAMCAKGIIGEDAYGNPNWYLLSQIIVDGTGVHQHVQSVQETADGSASILEQAGMELNAQGVLIYADDNTNMVGAKFNVQASKIGMVVGTRTVQGQEENYIKAGEITLAINNAGESEAHIDANKVYIGNDKSTTVIAGKCSLSDVTANYIQSKIADLSVLNVAAVSATGNIHTSNGYIAAPYYYIGSGNSLQNMASGIWALQITSSGNTYTLQKKDWDDSGWVDVGSFSRAVASWTMGWSSGIFTATANPQSQSASTTITQGTPSWDGTDVTIPIMGEDSDNPGYSYSTGRNVLVSVAGKLETKSVSGAYAGMTLTPGEGKIGFSSVTIGALTEYKISESWGTGNESNKLIISRASTGSTSITHTITAAASVSFNSSTNKFHATAKAKVDGTEKDNDSDDSGVISIALNSMQGSGASAFRTASVKNGSTEIVTSGNITDYGDGYTEGYNAGWNAACALISRSGNSIIGPVTGKATATSGRTETKYTANYTASSHSYTAAKYTASSYTKESHSYTASSHSFTQATCKTNGTNHTKYYYNGNFSGSIEYTPATDSYTASKHSYTASKYTASSFTAASHSYTASSFSWS